MFRRACLVVALCALVPSVAAQPGSDPPVEVSAEPDESLPNGRLLPTTGQARVLIRLDVGCELPPTREESEVTFQVDTTAPYASVILSPSSTKYDIPLEACADSTYRRSVEIQAVVTTTLSAPAMQPFETTVSAIIQAPSGEYGPYSVSFTLVNDYLPLTLLNPVQLFAKAEPGTTVVFPVEVQNLGNGPTRVTLEALQPNQKKLDAVDPGPVVVLESRATHGPEARFKKLHEIRVETPGAGGYVNDIYQFHVKYSGRYDGDAPGALEMDEQTIAFAVQVQGGLGGAVPSLSPPAILFALCAALLVRRRAS